MTPQERQNRLASMLRYMEEERYFVPVELDMEAIRHVVALHGRIIANDPRKKIKEYVPPEEPEEKVAGRKNNGSDV